MLSFGQIKSNQFLGYLGVFCQKQQQLQLQSHNCQKIEEGGEYEANSDIKIKHKKANERYEKETKQRNVGEMVNESDKRIV